MPVVAIVTARGGSKRLPGKNLEVVAGNSLVGWAVQHGRASRSVDEVVVSTDDAAIAAEVVRSDARVVDRPPDLATDSARSVDVVLHVLDDLSVDDDTVVVLLQPTSPLRTAGDIDACVRLLREVEGAGSVVSVTTVAHHPWKTYLVDADALYLMPTVDHEHLETPQQQLPEAVRPNGAVYVVRAEDLRRVHRFGVDPIVPYRMPPSRSVDIDTARDLEEVRRRLSERS